MPPAGTVFDVWVKQDTMLMFFMVPAILLSVKKGCLYSGLTFGLGMPTKENALFITMVLFLFSVFTWSKDRLKGSALTAIIGGLMSFWWYLRVSDYMRYFRGFFSRPAEIDIKFMKSWHYYFSGLPVDLNLVVPAFLVLGIIYSAYRRSSGQRDYPLPSIWFVSILVFLSISKV
jgi:phosphatidylserine synthase